MSGDWSSDVCSSDLKNNNLPDKVPGGYQAPKATMACILGGSLAPKSNNQFKQFARELNAALPGIEAS